MVSAAGESGYGGAMSDYSEHGAVPVEDASNPDPPTVAEVMAAQERDDPKQAATRLGMDPSVTSIDDLPSGEDADGG
jgi:hypothetical protein